MIGHTFITLEGRYYDAECPCGVARAIDLPYFVRSLNNHRSMTPLWKELFELENLSWEPYAHGRCHLFGLASLESGASLMTAWEMAALDEETLEPLPPCLIPSWIELPDGMCVDASGLRLKEYIESEYFTAINDLDVIEMSEAQILKLIRDRVLDDPDDGEMAKLRRVAVKARAAVEPTRSSTASMQPPR